MGEKIVGALTRSNESEAEIQIVRDAVENGNETAMDVIMKELKSNPDNLKTAIRTIRDAVAEKK